MTKLDRFIHLLVAASLGLLLLCCLQPVTAVADASQTRYRRSAFPR